MKKIFLEEFPNGPSALKTTCQYCCSVVNKRVRICIVEHVLNSDRGKEFSNDEKDLLLWTLSIISRYFKGFIASTFTFQVLFVNLKEHYAEPGIKYNNY